MVHTRCGRATEVQAIDSEGQRNPAGHSGGDAPRAAADGRPARDSSGDFFTLRRLWPLAAIACGIAVFFLLDLDSYITFEALKRNRGWLLDQIARHRIVTVIAFIGIYAAIVTLSLPGATVTSITGGFLFGLWFGTAWNVIGATIGATLLFLAARYVFSDILHRKAGPWLAVLESRFQENAFSYLLFLRLVPLFPFFVVNLVPAFLGVRLRTFVVTTFFGIIPGGLVYTSFGAGLGAIFDRGEEFSVREIVTPEIAAAMTGLALLSLLPAVVRWRQKKRG